VASLNPYAALRAEARRRRKQVLQSAAKDSAEGKEVNCVELQKQLAALDALAELRSFPEWLLAASLPFALALLVLIPLWWIRQPAPPIELNARASRVVLALDGPAELDLGKFSGLKSLRVQGVTRVSSDMPGATFASKDGRGSWHVEGTTNVSHVVLRPLPGGANQALPQLVLGRRGEAAHLTVERMALELSASVEREAKAVWTDGPVARKVALRNAGIKIESASSPAAPTHAYLILGKDPVQLPVLHPRALALREAAFDIAGRRLALSSVLEGELVIAGSGRKHALARNVELVLDELSGNLLVSLEAEGLRVSYAGTAGVIRLGSDTTLVRDLRPTLAEWLSRDPVLPLVWSSFVFLAGLAWTVRRFVRRPASS
jgi:hypothetical protein